MIERQRSLTTAIIQDTTAIIQKMIGCTKMLASKSVRFHMKQAP